MTINITEVDGTLGKVSGRWRARIIEGNRWGSSGFYPAEVLERDGATTWPKGTAIFFDHPSEQEMFDRPERSVRDLAGRIASTPAYEAAGPEGPGLYSDVEFYAHAAPIVGEMAKDIGLSIRASAETQTGEAQGRSGTIVTRLVEGFSVDLVTKAGAGGKLVSLIESARPNLVTDTEQRREERGAAAVDDIDRVVRSLHEQNQKLTERKKRVLAEANAEDTHQAIQRAVRTAYATPDGEGRGWLRDFDPDLNLAFIQVSGELVQRTYELNTDGTATLQPDAVRVTARTVYTPIEGSQNSDTTSVPAPVGQSPATESRKDNTMATTQIEESELGRLREDAGRVQALESERDTAVRERDQARQELAESQRRTAARTVIEAQASEHDVTFSPLEERGLLASLPLTENGEFDEAAFTETVIAEAARKAEASGAGSVRGFGSSAKVTESKTTSNTNAWDDIDTHLGISKEA